MFDPFKKARVRTRKRVSRAQLKAVKNSWGMMLTSPKPKRKSTKKPKAKPVKRTSSPRSPSTNTSKPRVTPKTTPRTAQSKSTVPRGGSFRTEEFDCEFGARSYDLYLPRLAKTATEPLPLIMMLHGCGQTPKDFARGTGMNTLAEEFGFVVVYPAQARTAHINRCWNWFKPSDQMRGAGEPALLAALTQDIIATHKIDPSKVYIAGLSAGASIATLIGQAYPDVFAAVGIHSGLAAGAAHDAASATTAMQIGNAGLRHATPMPTIIFHGSADTVVNPRNGRFAAIRAVEAYRGLDRVEKSGRVAGGRAYVRTTHRIGRGRSYIEHWVSEGAGHAWSGGHRAGHFTDPKGPDASREMVKFFLRHRTTKKRRAVPVGPA